MESWPIVLSDYQILTLVYVELISQLIILLMVNQIEANNLGVKCKTLMLNYFFYLFSAL